MYAESARTTQIAYAEANDLWRVVFRDLDLTTHDALPKLTTWDLQVYECDLPCLESPTGYKLRNAGAKSAEVRRPIKSSALMRRQASFIISSRFYFFQYLSYLVLLQRRRALVVG